MPIFILFRTLSVIGAATILGYLCLPAVFLLGAHPAPWTWGLVYLLALGGMWGVLSILFAPHQPFPRTAILYGGGAAAGAAIGVLSGIPVNELARHAAFGLLLGGNIVILAYLEQGHAVSQR